MITLVLSVVLQSCGTTGSVSGRFHGEILGQEVNFQGEVHWGPPVPSLPPGSTYLGSITVKGVTVEVFKDPDGNCWIRTPGDSNYNKVDCNQINLPDPPTVDPDPNPADPAEPVEVDPNQHSGQQSVTTPPGSQAPADVPFTANFAFDESTDSASLSFLLPANCAHNFVDPDNGPYNVIWRATPRADGSLAVSYHGSINGVLGAAMQQGIKKLTYQDATVGQVDVAIDYTWSAAFLRVNGTPVDPSVHVPFRPIYDER